MRRVVTGLVLVWTVGTSACQGDVPDGAGDLSARSLEPAVSAWVSRGADATPAALLSHRASTGSGDDAIGLKWTVEPPELQVYRATAVHLRVERFPEGHPEATCSWSFGDGTPSQTGCRISHTYHGGQADQVVSLTLEDGDWTWNTSRPVRLERLAVVKGLLGDDAPKMDGIPARPSGSGSKLRFAVISDGSTEGGPSADTARAVQQLGGEVKPDLVFHLGGLTTPEGSYAKTVAEIREPLEAANIAWLPAQSPTDLTSEETLTAPDLRFVDREGFPRRYSFTREGAFFLILATGEDGVREEDIAWMRAQLSSASVYEARYVFSPLPLHKFTDKHVGSLNKRFRLYELFLRARVTALFSASYRVYFKGRYGALPVVSVGSLVPPGGSLAGHDFSQPTSLAVVDQHKGIPVRIFGVQGPDFDRPLDESMLPEAVEVYTR
ncbi:MAG: hypothetical protein VX938_08985 [Myxococcota bacterium]|nr:hypothetical protein [Myxococcota bacterium]